MLATLIESGATRARKPAASALSVLVHAGLITAAVLATQQIESIGDKPLIETIIDVWPTPPMPTVAVAPAVAPLPRGFRVLVAPVNIPDVLPAIDLTRAATDPDAFTGVGVPGGVPDGVVGAPPGTVFTPDQVERTAQLVAGTGVPVYPAALRAAGLAGSVELEFVIDTIGRADLRTVHVVSSTHDRFSDAALKALAKARFAPAELGGRKVLQRVRMPFVFTVKGSS